MPAEFYLALRNAMMRACHYLSFQQAPQEKKNHARASFVCNGIGVSALTSGSSFLPSFTGSAACTDVIRSGEMVPWVVDRRTVKTEYCLKVAASDRTEHRSWYWHAYAYNIMKCAITKNMSCCSSWIQVAIRYSKSSSLHDHESSHDFQLRVMNKPYQPPLDADNRRSSTKYHYPGDKYQIGTSPVGKWFQSIEYGEYSAYFSISRMVFLHPNWCCQRCRSLMTPWHANPVPPRWAPAPSQRFEPDDLAVPLLAPWLRSGITYRSCQRIDHLDGTD